MRKKIYSIDMIAFKQNAKNDELRNGVTKDAFIRIKQEVTRSTETSSFGPCRERPSTRASYYGVEPTSLAAEPTKLSRACQARACYLMSLVEGCNPSPTISPPPQFTCERLIGLSEFVGQVRNRLSREEKGKDIAASPSPARDADGGSLDEFDIIHRDAMRDTENMSLSQRLLVADAHRQFREEAEGNAEDEGGEASGASGAEAPSQVVRPRRRAQRRALRHPNTIAYPEKFFETAQLIATHSHLRWPDLSREWIRRQQARIARESRLPCVLGPRKSRLSLFTRKQQKLLNKAREMEGIPDLSALLKGKLQMLSTKSSSAGASEVRPVPTDGDVDSEPPAQSSPKEKASKAKKRSVPLEEAPSSAAASEVAAKKKKKKKDSKKRSREEASVEVLETSAAGGDDDAGRHDPTDSTRGSSEERPKKKSKKTTAEDDGTPAPEVPSRSGEQATETGDGSRDESPLKRLRAENKKDSDKAAKEKEILRVKFAELEDKLKTDRLEKKDALREKARLERLVASLEKEKTELEGERDAVVGTLVKERERVSNSRIQEVTRERIRVQTAMADKSTRCFGRVKDYLDRLNALEKAKSLYGQASGTKKCLEVIRDSGTEIPQEMIDIFSEQEKLHEAEVAKLRLDPFSEADFALSPLNLPSRFVSEELMGTLDLYGSNVGLIGHESASQLITSREAADDPIDEPMIDITSALSKRVNVPEGTAVEECPDKNDPEVGGNAIQEETGDVAAEDPVLVSSSEEREDDEGGDQEENRSSPALIEEAAPNPSASDPPAQIEGLNAHVAEETVESLDPAVSNKDDQDTVA
ncbi:hypothetical protein IGI04_014980 [Brassica rapa subsp. trilocularis]|uniref:Uncharacterized protein n=1 Tax=Brassica rapa subsp. trilocularis TaxID=1813537 RepID=A0ABQ7MNR5_BRACM|nr:hypothetical protein IGI04_014980 [Brassica rapa subsp. trilocularis]